jgi:hypothetical protein
MNMALSRMLGVLVMALGTTLAACGGGTPPAQQTTPQPGVLRDLLKDWPDQKDMMVKIADAMPEDKFGFKSTPAQRSYGEQIMHVALTNAGLLKAIGGRAAPPSFTADSAKTKADIVKALADSYDYGAALLKEQTEATIAETIQEPSFLGASTRARIYWQLLAHSMDIYGQMAVYLRLNSIVPPASRNP